MTSQEPILLSTKLTIPAPRRNYVARHALFEKLAAAGEHSVVYIQGGAGTGKTMLLSTFLHEAALPNVCWVTLDASVANLALFWLYVTAALSTVVDDGDDLTELVRANPALPQMENMLTMLINRLSGDTHYYLVLDDAQTLTDPELLKTLAFFIGAMPPNLHLFLLSRAEPPLYLGALAMAGKLLYIGSDQMQLTRAEGLAFLQGTLDYGASDDDRIQLYEYAEGWIGGLQLAATAGAKSGYLLKSGGGIAAEYLNREILDALSAAERAFLIRTSCVSYLDAELAAVLMGGISPAEAQQMLDTLIRRNLFILCVEETRGVYRYHNILADFLAEQFARLPQAEQADLRKTAADMFAALGDREEAMRLYSKAGDYCALMRLATAMSGRIEAWLYLDQVPDAVLLDDADLAAQCFLYNLGLFHIERCRALYELFRVRYAGSDLLRVMQFMESYLQQSDGVLPTYEPLTREQIENLRFSPVSKAIILIENASALMECMRYKDAEECIRSAMQLAAGANALVAFFASNQLAQVYEETGRLRECLDVYAHAAAALKSPRMMVGIGTNYYFGIAGVYLRRMELEKAAETLATIESVMQSQGIRSDITDMTLLYHKAELQFLTGEEENATRLVTELRAAYPAYSTLTLGRLIHELACCGRLEEALGEQLIADLEAMPHYSVQPFFRLLRSRIRFLQGSYSDALAETDTVLAFSRQKHNRLHVVAAALQKAMLLTAGEEPVAWRSLGNLLREALHDAAEDQLRMPFFLERHTLIPLLGRLATEAVGKDALPAGDAAFLRDILVLCQTNMGTLSKAKKTQDTLSAREQEVLCALARGLSNREIAEALFISQATVKTHVLSVFNKLGVSSRLLAAEEGRLRGLIR